MLPLNFFVTKEKIDSETKNSPKSNSEQKIIVND